MEQGTETRGLSTVQRQARAAKALVSMLNASPELPSVVWTLRDATPDYVEGLACQPTEEERRRAVDSYGLVFQRDPIEQGATHPIVIVSTERGPVRISVFGHLRREATDA